MPHVLPSLLLSGTKKVPKAYVVAVSALRPNLAAVGTNTGMAFMTFDRMYPLPVGALPLRNMANAHISPNRMGMAETIHCSYVAHTGAAVWLVHCSAVEKVRAVGARCSAAGAPPAYELT